MKVFFLAFALFTAPVCFAQKQLVLLKNEKVQLRLYPGDEIVFKMKGSKDVRTSYVNNLFDTAVMAHKMIVPFHKIDRLYFKQSSFRHVLGTLLVIGGVGYFAIDQINETLVQGNDPNIESNVATSSAVMLAAGLPMMLIHKKSQRIGGKYRLLTIEKGSVFYREDTRTLIDN